MSDANEQQRKRQKTDGSAVGVTEDTADHVEGDAVETDAARCSTSPSSANEGAEETAGVEFFDQMDEYDREFGTEAAFVLTRDEPPKNPGALARELLEQAQKNPAEVRTWIDTKAAAIECNYCVEPLPLWDPEHPKQTTTCGRQQGFLVTGLDLEDVITRQKSRESQGDNVDYVLARTVRSQLQYEASRALGAKGKGNQCPRGACFKQLIDMFDGVKMEGVPRDVVLALLRH